MSTSKSGLRWNRVAHSELTALLRSIPSARSIGLSVVPAVVFYLTVRVWNQSIQVAGATAALAWVSTATFAHKRGLADSRGVLAAGAAGVAVSVVSALATGEARGYFLPSSLLPLLYGTAFWISILLRRPAVALAVSLASGKRAGIIGPRNQRAYYLLTALWASKMTIEGLVLMTIYFYGSLEWLLIGRIAFGWVGSLLLTAITLAALSSLPASNLPTDTPKKPATRDARSDGESSQGNAA